MKTDSNKSREEDLVDDSNRKRNGFVNLLAMPEVRIAVLYVLLASIWIVGSDMALNRSVEGPLRAAFLHSLKGLNFVLTTGVLLFFVLRKAYGGWRRSEERRFFGLRSARERYRSLSTRNQNQREEERTRIAREIHDELGQHLTAIKIQIRLIENRLSDRNDRSLNPVIDELVETSAMVDETIGSMQRISSGLRPPALDDLGLAAALDEEAEQFSRRTGIECKMPPCDIEQTIPPDIETTAFRIFQESLTNVARHSKARRVDSKYSLDDGVLTLSIRDDGVGIDPEVLENPTSLGLVGMLERANDAGGEVNFKSSPGHGTEVILKIPIRNAPPVSSS